MVKKIRRNRFAETLKTLRTSARLNQVALAQMLGCTQVTVSLYESGRREPDLDDLMTIAEKLNTTPNVLLGFEAPTLRDSAPLREIKTGDINGSFNIVGSNNTIAPPPSTSSSQSTSGRRRKCQRRSS